VATLRGLVVVVLFDVIGELLARHAHVPLPGPVIGMVLLLLAMSLAPRLAELCEAGASLLLRHMSLLFVPACVSALASIALLRVEGGRIVLALVVSTSLALVAGAWTFVLAARRRG
jgi:holin-like protein